MKPRVYLKVAAAIMLIVGLLRGFGGILLLMKGNNLAVEPAIQASNLISRICGAGLIILMIIFSYAAILLFRNKNNRGITMAWLGIGVFLVGGILNGYLLFGNPFVQDQIINIVSSLIIGVLLFLGKKSLSVQ